jgi:multiple sugar transport system ATP-binding protein
MAEIVLDGLTKSFGGGPPAVAGVDLTIADGEFIILVGPSGCGKSTTLNMIAGLEDISSGELRIDGHRVNEKAPRERDIAMVFQSYALYPHMSVRDNIAFPLKLARRDKAEIGAKVAEAARLLDLTPLLERRPGELSGGQRQRVAMGRAIVRSPKAFLMDEPLSNLDAKLRVQTRTTISRLQKRLAATTVYVTHDQTEAMTLGDRIVIMRKGRVQQIGAPQELYDVPHNLFVAGFIGSPAMNFLPARLTGDALATPLGTVPLTDRQRRALGAANAPREVIAGIRPEAFEDQAVLAEQGGPREEGVAFTAPVDIVESMGAEKLAYLSLEGETVDSEHLADLPADTAALDAGAGTQLVVRLSPRSRAREGEPLTVWFPAGAVRVFDPGSGLNLTVPGGVSP